VQIISEMRAVPREQRGVAKASFGLRGRKVTPASRGGFPLRPLSHGLLPVGNFGSFSPSKRRAAGSAQWAPRHHLKGTMETGLNSISQLAASPPSPAAIRSHGFTSPSCTALQHEGALCRSSRRCAPNGRGRARGSIPWWERGWGHRTAHGFKAGLGILRPSLNSWAPKGR